MKIGFAYAGIAALVIATAGQAANPGVEAPIRTMIVGFNKGDVALAKSTHVAAPMIVDEPTAPFVLVRSARV